MGLAGSGTVSEIVKHNPVVRLTLHRGEVTRLPWTSHLQDINIVSGLAWLTYNGRDVYLASGERRSFTNEKPGNDYAVLSALGKNPLVVEIRGK